MQHDETLLVFIYKCMLLYSNIEAKYNSKYLHFRVYHPFFCNLKNCYNSLRFSSLHYSTEVRLNYGIF